MKLSRSHRARSQKDHARFGDGWRRRPTGRAARGRNEAMRALDAELRAAHAKKIAAPVTRWAPAPRVWAPAPTPKPVEAELVRKDTSDPCHICFGYQKWEALVSGKPARVRCCNNAYCKSEAKRLVLGGVSSAPVKPAATVRPQLVPGSMKAELGERAKCHFCQVGSYMDRQFYSPSGELLGRSCAARKCVNLALEKTRLGESWGGSVATVAAPAAATGTPFNVFDSAATSLSQSWLWCDSCLQWETGGRRVSREEIEAAGGVPV